METWRFVDTGYSDPAMNMAIDEAILHAHSMGEVAPTIRFYTWDPPTLSIGYFQKANKEVDMDELKKRGIGFVRRPTGGRAVLHDQELTYSVIVSENHPMMPSSVNEAYRVISMGLLRGFQILGLSAEMVSLATDEEKKKFESIGSAACFDSPSWYELVVEGKKVAGSAQTRQKGTILQHGSILLDMDIDLLFDLLLFPNDRVKQRMKQAFHDKAVAINDLAEQKVTLKQAKEAFFQGFAEGLGVNLVRGDLTEFEKRLAEELVHTRYGNDEWNFKR